MKHDRHLGCDAMKMRAADKSYMAVIKASEGYRPPEVPPHKSGITNGTRRLVYRRDGYQCAMCSDTRGLQIHHAVHRSLGGSDFPENLITLCWKCHAVAHGMKFDDYPAYIDADWMEQHVVEYLSDWYAENRVDDPVWYPYK